MCFSLLNKRKPQCCIQQTTFYKSIARLKTTSTQNAYSCDKYICIYRKRGSLLSKNSHQMGLSEVLSALHGRNYSDVAPGVLAARSYVRRARRARARQRQRQTTERRDGPIKTGWAEPVIFKMFQKKTIRPIRICRISKYMHRYAETTDSRMIYGERTTHEGRHGGDTTSRQSTARKN